MSGKRKTVRFDLKSKETATCEGTGMLTVRCDSGNIWMTNGSGIDYVLRESCKEAVECHGQVVIQGIILSSVTVTIDD